MSAPQLLRHLHLPAITPFKAAENIQQTLASQFLAHKAAISRTTASQLSPLTPPTPTLLSFTPTPVYTTGRRELGTLSPTQITALTKPLTSKSSHPLTAITPSDVHPTVTQTLRGGQITFHGPGQLVLYPILDLKSIISARWPRGLTARCYVHLLEETTIRTLAHYGIQSRRTTDAGVWVDTDAKIAALGVHLRRNVTSYGVGLNVTTDLRYFERVVACGLVGKRMTSMLEVQNEKEAGMERGVREGVEHPEEVARIWAGLFAEGLWGNEGSITHATVGKRGALVKGVVEQGILSEAETKWALDLEGSLW